MAYPFRSFKSMEGQDGYRPGIDKAVHTIISRHNEGMLATSIILPCRYGKSDVIRLAALELVQNSEAIAALAMAPWDVLPSQLIRKEQLKQFSKRYLTALVENPPESFRGQRLPQITSTFHQTKRLTHLFTTTVPLVYKQLGRLECWIETCLHDGLDSGTRPIIFIDEGHLLADGAKSDSKWIQIHRMAVRKGAHVVILTGTPIRSDGNKIPGVRSHQVEEKDLQFTLYHRIDARQQRRAEYIGTRRTFILKADHQTPYSEAWNSKALLQLEAHWMKPKEALDERGRAWDEIPAKELRSYVRRAQTHPSLIKDAVKAVLEDYSSFRANEEGKEAAILVMTGADIFADGEEAQANYHARAVKREFEQQDSGLRVEIATQASDAEETRKERKARALIEEFQVGGNSRPIDVLIVKSMGCVGMDVPRAMILLYLSSVRPEGPWMQGILRVASTWKSFGVASVFLLDDPDNRENWNKLIEEQGGGLEITSTETQEVSSEVIDADDAPERSLTMDGVHTQSQDQQLRTAKEDDRIKVYKLFKKDPDLRQKYSVAELAEKIKAGLYNPDLFSEPTEEDQASPDIPVENVSDECAWRRNVLEELVKMATSKKVKYEAYDPVPWRLEKKRLSTECAKVASYNTPAECIEPDKLDRALDHIRSICHTRGIGENDVSRKIKEARDA